MAMQFPCNFMHRHFKIYKPANYLSQFVTLNKLKRKKLLGELGDFPQGTMAIGRLDAMSEGLLLLTTDGMFSEEIRSARYEKEYYAQVDGIMTEEALERLRKGVEIGFEGIKYMTKPCKAKLMNFPERLNLAYFQIRGEHHGPTSWVSITLTEGKYRQVRKMTAAVGFATLRLIRYRIDDWTIDGMRTGECVEVFSGK